MPISVDLPTADGYSILKVLGLLLPHVLEWRLIFFFTLAQHWFCT